MKYICFTLYLCVFFACEEGRPSIQKHSVAEFADTTAFNTTPIFWKTICENSRFNNLFDCNASDCYQIELLNDPFKDFIAIVINTQDSLSDEFSYYRFHFKTSNSASKANSSRDGNLIPIVNTLTHDTIFCISMGEKSIKTKKNTNVNTFFAKTIWDMPENDTEMSELDPETWRIKARVGERERILSRHSFKDSVFYSNIQYILNKCKIKDYTYKIVL